MENFKAQKLDLDFEIEILSGEIVNVKAKESMSASKCAEIIDAMAGIEERYNAIEKEDKTSKDAINMVGEELALIYDQEAQWFIDNIDIPTLNEILHGAATIIGNVSKK